MKKTWGLRIQLMLLMLILTLIPLLLFAVISQMTLYTTMKGSLEDRIRAELGRSNRSLTLTLEKYHTLLYDFATDDAIVAVIEAYNQGELSLEGAQNVLHSSMKHICHRNEGVSGMAVYTEDGSCIYYDLLSSSSTDSGWINEELNPAMEKVEEYRPVIPAAGAENYVFSIQRRLIDYQDIHLPVGNAVICVDAGVLQEAMEDSGEEFFFLVKDGVVVSSTNPEEIGEAISEIEIPIDSRNDYTMASEWNEKSGWNVVAYYPLARFNQTLRTQVAQLSAIVLVIVLLFAAGIYLVTHPVIDSAERLLAAMKRAGTGDYTARVVQQEDIPSEIWEISNGFNAMMEQIGSLEEEARRASLEQRNAEISALEAQIDPHFLYNVLDTINWKAISCEEYEISEMVSDLGDILRYAIRNAGGVTTLGQEIAWLKKYVRLQQEKIGREIQIFCEISSEAARAGMHKLLLQPFVENSIKHGLTVPDREPLLILTGTIRDGELIVTIEDNGKGLEGAMISTLNREDYHRENHFGIENVRKRLHLYYGEQAGVRFEAEAGRFTRVILRLPVLEKGEKL